MICLSNLLQMLAYSIPSFLFISNAQEREKNSEAKEKMSGGRNHPDMKTEEIHDKLISDMYSLGKEGQERDDKRRITFNV